MQGFFYNRYKPPTKSAELGTETDTNVDQQLWFHVVGTPQADDKFIYAVPEHPDWFISAEVTDDGRYRCSLGPFYQAFCVLNQTASLLCFAGNFQELFEVCVSSS
jgi:hypothetical protein